MKNLLLLFALTLTGLSCRPVAPDAVGPMLSGQSVLIYSQRQYMGSYEVTDYDASGIPVLAKTSFSLNMGIMPTGTYTSRVQLEYDALLRLKKTTQTYDQLGYASCCPGSIAFDPDRQLISEYEYQDNSRNVTHEVSYTLTPKTGQRVMGTEFFRRFTSGGQLTQEKRGTTTLYEATYDAHDNVLSETIFPASGFDQPAFTRRWTYQYDSDNHLLSRQISNSDGFETNTYDPQGRLIRRVTNLYELAGYAPTSQSIDATTPATQVRDNLIDQGFAKQAERSAMSFTYFRGQFLHGDIRVAAYAYKGDQTTITTAIYQLWNELPQARQPGFDFTQLPREAIMSVKEKTVQLNQQSKITGQAFRYSFISDKLKPEQLDATYASEFSYTYDEGGNLTSRRGATISPLDQATANPYPIYEARYKRF